MSLIALALFAQLAAPATRTLPVLAFPERGLDDSAAYQGYQTRLFRDAAGNTVQIYLDARADRVVHLWADAEDESFGFTARGAGGKSAALRWSGDGALVSRTARTRTLEHTLVAAEPRIDIGWFLLGSMRIERDLQYANRQKAPFAEAPFKLPEIDRMLAAMERLNTTLPKVAQQHLALLHATSVDELRARLRPRVVLREGIVSVLQPAFDGLDTLVMELRTDPARVTATVAGDSVTLRAKSGGEIPFAVRITTSGKALTPLGRRQIFNAQFLSFLAASRGSDAKARRLERQVRGLELLSSREKLMAGLPTYATYFGRDMLMTALMMKPVWRDEMSEFVIASALRKLSPTGQVSHEEAMGGQAVREAASEYTSMVLTGYEMAQTVEEASGLATVERMAGRAGKILEHLRRTRENYHMIDAEFQFPIVAARWLADPKVSADRKRAFLLDSTDNGEPRVRRLVRELALVARVTAPYAANPTPANLISFAPRDSGKWSSQSWRDSNVGYAGGRYAMDVNAIWAPHALESVGRILDALRTLNIAPSSARELAADTPLGRYSRDPQLLRKAVDRWNGAARHFVVTLAPSGVRTRTSARLAAMTPDERRHWTDVLARTHADADSLTFLALSLDGAGNAIPIANSDVATRLFLGDNELVRTSSDAEARAHVLRDVRLFARAYPVGLLVDSVGPVVANDAYASASVWRDFERDRYHGPRVVWGRENNLFLIGTMGRIADARAAHDPSSVAYVRELRAAIDKVSAAVEASGFHSELWSYDLQSGRVVPIRYGSGSDVQLWSTTDLVVQYGRWQLR